MKTAKTFCRVCHLGCGVVLSIDENDCIVGVRGDKDHESTRGYVCFKGQQAGDAHHGSARLLNSLKRQHDGSHAPIPAEQAQDEIADKLRLIRDRHGPNAIALYLGGGAFFSTAAFGLYKGFLSALGSKQYFTGATIDQPNKGISRARLGGWAPGVQDLDQSEVALLLGANPLVSQQAIGLLNADAGRRLRAAKKRGLKLICIDPRRTETARQSDLFLQPLPGQDPAILVGLIRLILVEGWEDREFCARHVGAERLADLRTAVAPFTSELVEQRAGLEPGQIRAVAQMFARDHKTGPAVMTTGGSFAPFSNLTRHLLDLLNVICGRFKRAGDRVVIDMFMPPGPIRAEVLPPMRYWESLPPSRIRGIDSFFGERLTGTLADEILMPGQDQIKCLIVGGGNPATIVPDQSRMATALRSLELSVTIDPFFTTTAQLSDYVIAPTMMYERADTSFTYLGSSFHYNSHAQYSPAVIRPAASSLIDDSHFLWGLAKRLGLQITYCKVPLDGETQPSREELLAIRCRGARVSLDELRQYPSGKAFEHPDCVVAEARPEANARFDVMPADVADELKAFLASAGEQGKHVSNGRTFKYLLSSRRSPYIFNSTLTQLPEVLKRHPNNPVFIHPDDMVEQGIAAGQEVEIESDYDHITTVAQPDKDMRRGVISMVHGWGGPKEAFLQRGANVNALIDSRSNSEAITAMPRMSAIPVNIRAVRS